MSLRPNGLSPESLKVLERIDVQSLPVVEGTPRLGIPYVGTGKFIAIGLNYSDHAKETNQQVPKEPMVFLKATSCLNGPYDNIVLPKDSTKADWEVELGRRYWHQGAVCLRGGCAQACRRATAW